MRKKMAFFDLEVKLFPDDEPTIPPPGSLKQQKMIQLMEEVCDEDYEENLDFLEVPFNQVLENHVTTTIELLKLSKKESCRNLRILDLGTGMGLTTISFLERFDSIKSVCLVDLSMVLLERAEKKILRQFPDVEIQKLQFDLLGDDLTSVFPENNFDLVLASNLFEHITRPRQAEIFKQVHHISPFAHFILGKINYGQGLKKLKIIVI